MTGQERDATAKRGGFHGRARCRSALPGSRRVGAVAGLAFLVSAGPALAQVTVAPRPGLLVCGATGTGVDPAVLRIVTSAMQSAIAGRMSATLLTTWEQAVAPGDAGSAVSACAGAVQAQGLAGGFLAVVQPVGGSVVVEVRLVERVGGSPVVEVGQGPMEQMVQICSDVTGAVLQRAGLSAAPSSSSAVTTWPSPPNYQGAGASTGPRSYSPAPTPGAPLATPTAEESGTDVNLILTWTGGVTLGVFWLLGGLGPNVVTPADEDEKYVAWIPIAGPFVGAGLCMNADDQLRADGMMVDCKTLAFSLYLADGILQFAGALILGLGLLLHDETGGSDQASAGPWIAVLPSLNGLSIAGRW